MQACIHQSKVPSVMGFGSSIESVGARVGGEFRHHELTQQLGDGQPRFRG